MPAKNLPAKIKRILKLTVIALSVAAAFLLGFWWPHSLNPTDRVAPRSENMNRQIRTEVIFRTNPVEKLIALTFDDGPDLKWTPLALDMLQKHQVPATFFVIGSAVQAQPEILKSTAEAGHVIGVHDWEHRDVNSQDYPTYQTRLRQTIAEITKVTGEVPTLIRPPYGRLDSPSLFAMAEQNLTTILWSHHFPGQDAAYARKIAEDTASPGMIVLAHDGRGDPTEELYLELELFIVEMQSQGYRFVTIPELLAADSAP